MSKFSDLIKSSTPLLVDFSAEWCGPCKTMAPILKEVAQNMEDKVKVIKVDVDKNQQAAASYKIQSVPTLMLFRYGKVLWRQSGVIQANQLEKIITQFL